MAQCVASCTGVSIMSRNIEIKARVEDLDTVAEKVALIADSGPTELEQEDIFFRCDSGRLKLRVFSDGSGELIYYRRADQGGPKESFYLRSPTSVPDILGESLTLAYGQAGRVVKHRTLYVVGRTRVHLDAVQGLGRFLELEVVLRDDESSQAGIVEALGLMERLGVTPEQLIDGAYVDLLARRG